MKTWNLRMKSYGGEQQRDKGHRPTDDSRLPVSGDAGLAVHVLGGIFEPDGIHRNRHDRTRKPTDRSWK